MPDGLYFEATKRPKRPFLISLGDIVKVVATPKGFCLELKNIASVGKRFKMKCKKADELIGRLEKIL